LRSVLLFPFLLSLWIGVRHVGIPPGVDRIIFDFAVLLLNTKLSALSGGHTWATKPTFPVVSLGLLRRQGQQNQQDL
ncbi:MAG: hypothetical protein WA715_13690, partial [Candidatus Acidiferrum sp.]